MRNPIKELKKSKRKCTRKTNWFSKLHARLNKCKELEDIVIRASKEIKTKDDLINKWKNKCETIEEQLLSFQKDSEDRIEELEVDWEKLLKEKRDSDSKHRREIDDLKSSITNLKKDCDHYADLLQACEDNWSTMCQQKIITLSGTFLILIKYRETYYSGKCNY